MFGCCVLSGCGERGYSLAAALSLFTAVAPLVVGHRLQACGLRVTRHRLQGVRAQQSRSTGSRACGLSSHDAQAPGHVGSVVTMHRLQGVWAQ